MTIMNTATVHGSHIPRSPYAARVVDPIYSYIECRLDAQLEEIQSQIDSIRSCTLDLPQQIYNLENGCAANRRNWEVLSKRCTEQEAIIHALQKKIKDLTTYHQDCLKQARGECERLSDEIMQLKVHFNAELSNLKEEIKNAKQQSQTDLQAAFTQYKTDTDRQFASIIQRIDTQTSRLKSELKEAKQQSQTNLHTAIAQNKKDVDRLITSTIPRIDEQIRNLKDEIKKAKLQPQTSQTELETALSQIKTDIDHQIASIVQRLEQLSEDRQKQKEVVPEKPPLELTAVEKPARPIPIKNKTPPQPPAATKGKTPQTVKEMSDGEFDKALEEHQAKVSDSATKKKSNKPLTRSPRRSLNPGNSTMKRDLRETMDGAFLSNSIAMHYQGLLRHELSDILPDAAIVSIREAMQTANAISNLSTKQ